MNKLLNRLVIIWMVLLFSLAGCTPATTPQPITQAPPTQAIPTPNPLAAIVRGAAERLNAGDLEGSLAYWTDDAEFTFIGLPGGTETYSGKEQIRTVLKENVANHFEMQVDILKMDGDTATTRTTTWHDFTRQLGVAPLIATELYVIQDGKIASITWTLSDESQAKLNSAIAAAEAAPTSTASQEAVIEVTALEEILGAWKTSCGGNSCFYEFSPDGKFKGVMTEEGGSKGIIDQGMVTFQDGVIYFEPSAGLCENKQKGTYQAFLTLRGGKPARIEFKKIQDECADRANAMRNMPYLSQ